MLSAICYLFSLAVFGMQWALPEFGRVPAMILATSAELEPP